jgi:hypothetical protein
MPTYRCQLQISIELRTGTVPTGTCAQFLPVPKNHLVDKNTEDITVPSSNGAGVRIPALFSTYALGKLLKELQTYLSVK